MDKSLLKIIIQIAHNNPKKQPQAKKIHTKFSLSYTTNTDKKVGRDREINVIKPPKSLTEKEALYRLKIYIQ